MVRLQKIAYEKLVNSNTLGRARKLTTPAKWFTTNPLLHMRRYAYEFNEKTFLGRILYPIIRRIYNIERAYQRDLFLQRGLTFEDARLHSDEELRRCVLFEHIARESLHPYHWVLKVRRRQRYFRIERGIRGYFVPDFIRNQAKTQTYRDFIRLHEEWMEFKHQNYFSDMTPVARRSTTQQYITFDNLFNFGILQEEAYDRYFFQERDNGWFTPEQVQWTKDPRKFPYDLTTQQGKQKFESQVKQVNEKYPGIVAVEGQKFDFKRYYASIGL